MSTFQIRCDQLSKILAVVLAFSIPISTTLTQILLILIMLAITGARQWQTRIQWVMAYPALQFAMGLLLIFCLGIFYATVPLSDSLGMLNKMSKMIYIPILIPLFTEQKWRRAALLAFIAAMVLSFILGALKHYHYLPAMALSRYPHCAFKNHIDTNLLMSMAVFFLAHDLCLHKHHYYRYIKISLGILLSLMVVYILGVSQGRTGYVVFAALWMLFLWQRSTLKQGLLGISVLILIMGVACLLPSQLQERMTEGVNQWNLYQKTGNTHHSIGERLEYFQSSLAIFKQNPWFGTGTGGFRQAYANYAKEHFLTPTKNPHNEYLNILVQWGSLGLLVFCVFIYQLYKTSLLLPIEEKHYLQGTVFGILVGSLANSLLMDVTSGYFFVTFVALNLASLPLRVKQNNSHTTIEAAGLVANARVNL